MSPPRPILRCHDLLSRLTLRARIAAAIVVVALLAGLASMLEARSCVWGCFSKQLDGRSLAIAEYLEAHSADFVASQNEYELQRLVTGTVETDEDVIYAFIQDRNGAVLAHSFGSTFPVELLHATRPQSSRIAYFETERGRVHDSAAPILGGLLGTARVGLSEKHMNECAAQVTQRIAGWTVGLAVAGLLVSLLISRASLAPLMRLRDAAAAMAQGDFSLRPVAGSRDEIGALAQSFSTMADALEITQRQLSESNAELRAKEQRLAELLASTQSAQEAERLHIARELHDETSQSLASLMVELRVLENLTETETLRERAAGLRARCSDILDGVQDISRHLRPKALEELGLDDAVRGLAEETAERFGFRLDFQVIGAAPNERCDETELVLYRIVQEALTNVAKHAEASDVSVILEYRPASIFAIVEDDGKGFELTALDETDSGGLGIFGMQERAALAGGSLTIESSEGGGTTVYVELPLDVVS